MGASSVEILHLFWTKSILSLAYASSIFRFTVVSAKKTHWFSKLKREELEDVGQVFAVVFDVFQRLDLGFQQNLQCVDVLADIFDFLTFLQYA